MGLKKQGDDVDTGEGFFLFESEDSWLHSDCEGISDGEKNRAGRRDPFVLKGDEKRVETQK